MIPFEKDTIEIKAGESFLVRPVYSKSVAKVEWAPTIGLRTYEYFGIR